MDDLSYGYNTLEEYLYEGKRARISTAGDVFPNRWIRAFIKRIVPDYAEQYANGTIVFTEAQSLEMSGRLMGLLRPRLAQIKEWDGESIHLLKIVNGCAE